ncbi:hypothetical protein HanXRQr2_Chr01g0026951 [Helianthus annuus]|uniref:Uncharacterized protein n=1 Tax=Helianthus annuus TaxID=4232 RepID=A0A9K3JXE5_HELAN|nr:hypothetical protein HanXRQr2_Chr01g0026951 [Helianthus annuus]
MVTCKSTSLCLTDECSGSRGTPDADYSPQEQRQPPEIGFTGKFLLVPCFDF